MTSKVTKKKPTSELVELFNKITYVDNSAVIAKELAKLSGFQVTEANIKEAKKVRHELATLLEQAKGGRMTVQRAIKAHPIGTFAFLKTDVERDIESEDKRLKDEIEKITKPNCADIKTGKKAWHCLITCDLNTINKLAGELADRGIEFENLGYEGMGQL